MKYLLCLIGIHSLDEWEPKYFTENMPEVKIVFRQRRFCTRCNHVEYRDTK